MFCADLDPELDEAIKIATPEFASSLKRRFTNVGVSRTLKKRETTSSSTIQFDDLFFRDGSNQIILRNLKIKNPPIARMNEIIPNLEERHLRISADWYNIVISGSYEMYNSSQLTILPVSNVGHIDITIENVSTKGLTGFTIVGEALKTTNFDLKFSAKNVSVQAEFSDHDSQSVTYSTYEKENIDNTIAKYIKRDLFWKLQETLRDRLDYVLLDFTISEIFADNKDVMQNFRNQNLLVNDFITKVVDKLILALRAYLVSRDLGKYPIDDLHANFSHKFGLVTFWGGFQANGGSIRNLASIRRIGNFSIATHPDSGEVEIFGTIGLEECILTFNRYTAHIWNLGPWGEIQASSGINEVSLKVVTNVKNVFDNDIFIKDYDLRVVKLEKIKVEATGLSVALDWLLSYIATWVTGVFKNNIITMIEEKLHQVVQKNLNLNGKQYQNGYAAHIK